MPKTEKDISKCPLSRQRIESLNRGGGDGGLSAPLLSSPTKFSTVSQSSFPNLEFLFQFFRFSFFSNLYVFKIIVREGCANRLNKWLLT